MRKPFASFFNSLGRWPFKAILTTLQQLEEKVMSRLGKLEEELRQQREALGEAFQRVDTHLDSVEEQIRTLEQRLEAQGVSDAQIDAAIATLRENTEQIRTIGTDAGRIPPASTGGGEASGGGSGSTTGEVSAESSAGGPASSFDE